LGRWPSLRYAHLDPSHFTARELGAITVDLSAPAGKVVPFGNVVATHPDSEAAHEVG
jgi:hypothetical protein